MKGYFELKGSVMTKDFNLKCFVSMDAMLNYCEKKGIDFETMLSGFTAKKTKGQVGNLFNMMKGMIYEAHLSYCLVMDETPKIKPEMIGLILSGSGDMEKTMVDFMEVFVQNMPGVKDLPKGTKKGKVAV